MNEVLIAPDDVREIADSFRAGSKDTQKTVDNLEKAMAVLQSKWQGSTQQMFYRDYKEWHTHALGFVMVLSNIARELDAMAERFAGADN